MRNMVIQTGRLEGHFTGFRKRGTLFRFEDGTEWRQVDDRVYSTDHFNPTARVIAQQGCLFLDIEGVQEWVPVSRQHRCHGYSKA